MANTSDGVDTTAPGSALQLFNLREGKRGCPCAPAALVMNALCAGLPVRLPDGGEYQLSEDWRIGISAPGHGLVFPTGMSMDEFFELCNRLSFDESFMISSNTALNSMQRDGTLSGKNR